LTMLADGGFSYAPVSSSTYSDTFWYTVTDGQQSTFSVVTIDVASLTAAASVNTAGANPHVGAADGNQRETTIAINPANLNQVFCASNIAGSDPKLYASYST